MDVVVVACGCAALALACLATYCLCSACAGRGARAAPAIRLLEPAAPKPPLGPLVGQAGLHKVPPWIQADRGFFGRFPSLEKDPLFQNNGDPRLLPFVPPGGKPKGRGAVIICPGGNYEFLSPGEGAPMACWAAEALGVPAYVLKYRLLPDFGLQEMLEDFAIAVRTVRRLNGDCPVAAIGFSAGAHLIAAGCAAAAADAPERPNAQVLVYPSLDATEWLDKRLAGFVLTDVASPQVRSLAMGPGSRARLLANGPDYLKPPPTFMVVSTIDGVCRADKHGDLYAAAARQSGAELQYLRGPFGAHGFGLQDFWSKPCAKWMRGQGLGLADGKQKAS